MTRLYAILGAIGATVAAVFAAFFMGGKNAKAKLDAKQSKASLDAEINRSKLDAEIDQDDDLAARARRSGLRGPGTE